MQVPPWQLVEQHCVPEVQAFPSVVQLETVVLTCWQTLPVQIPEQHWLGLVQLAPVVVQAVPAQSPPLHVREQHCEPSVQAVPKLPQNDEDVQTPLAQTVEQQSAFCVQPSPPTLQLDTGAPHEPALQLPEQQSQGFVQEPLLRQVAGSTQ